jgi:hypothetical protein
MVDSLEHYVGHCPLSEVYFIYTTFRELALQAIGCHKTAFFIVSGNGWDRTQDLLNARVVR